MLVLTGTSGQLGGGVLKYILSKNLIPPSQLIISASNPTTVPAFAKEAGIPIRHGDMKKPSTLESSYQGADILFLVTFPSIGMERVELHKAAIDAAKKVGVKHVIYTSLMFGGETGEKSKAEVMQPHIQSVAYLKASGMTWTIVREGIYAEIWNHFAGLIQVDDTVDPIDIVVAGDGPVAWTARQELSEGTAVVVANAEQYQNQSIRLTGPRADSIHDIATLLREHTGRKVNVRILPAEEAIAYHQAHQSVAPEQYPSMTNWASYFRAMEDGETGVVDPLLEKLLGRKPKGIAEMANKLFAPHAV